MKNLSFIFLLLLTCAVRAQVSDNMVNGSIQIPSLQRLQIEMLNNGPIHFKTPQELVQGKTILNFFRVNVGSTIPWLVSIKSGSSNFEASSMASQNMPPSVVSFRGNYSSNFIPLSTTPKSLLVCQNTNILNTYNIDLKIDPSWNFGGGTYSLPLVIILTAE